MISLQELGLQLDESESEVDAIGRNVAAFMALESAAAEQAAGERLTPREVEVLQLVADGVPRKEIASRLHMSRWTVQAHCRSMRERLGVHSMAHAVAICIRHGVID